MNTARTKSRTLIVGAGAFVTELAMAIDARPQCRYELVGIVSSQSNVEGTHSGYPLLGSIEELHNIILTARADRIIVTLPRGGELLPLNQLIEARMANDIAVEDGEVVYERLTGKLRIEDLEPRSVIFAKDLKPSRFSSMMARAISLCAALVGFLLFIPLFAVIAVAIRMDSAGPVLFVQERVGLGGKPFKLLKFRTMRPSTQKTSEWAADNGHRITKVGKVLRKYRLDELPQFLNVLKGDMNIVGPRPHPASNFRLFVLVSRNTPECGLQVPYYSLRLMVRPGITGWAQVRYRYANNLREEIEKLRFDLYYVKHYSLWLDLRILFETVAVVVLGREQADLDDADKEVSAEGHGRF